MRLLILGAGGHALVVLEALDALGWDVAGVLDDRATAPILGRPVLGPLASLGAHGATRAVVALGDNATRLEWGEAARQAGLALPALVHPAALVSPSARIGDGAQVMARASVGPLAVIGALALVNTAAVVEHECVVEGGAHVAPGAVLCGAVRVGVGALVGAGAVVAPGRRLGAGAVAGAGAAVVRDVAAGAVVAGVPARPLGV
ncbi:NeuD/PglB/VioB family sugar acetyltransferase [Roseococcus suduntuyensis]|uniref:Sugar O-acyltransferase (Sialic acid O-acetyltransferase NeuD family) n=1 Tax=Roseococcus suduntuyensis TaxID=455361 RepID=A0A840AFI7_9PROT|nr:NeuD/PglB/VioB family sugar acetyltransferase [Roseococcus suduntuyensis]MBB3898865.1 sugar O-acyltransferase (sialic acid O-acetyltransferase NeuD family) [Roseococcus suduntuyensis]